jgi:hypothetical protein
MITFFLTEHTAARKSSSGFNFNQYPVEMCKMAVGLEKAETTELFSPALLSLLVGLLVGRWWGGGGGWVGWVVAPKRAVKFQGCDVRDTCVAI